MSNVLAKLVFAVVAVCAPLDLALDGGDDEQTL